MGSFSPKFEVIWNIYNQPPSITISQITIDDGHDGRFNLKISDPKVT